MAIKKIEVGDISNSVFQLLVLDAIHTVEIGHKATGTMLDGWQISVNLSTENQFVISYLNRTEHTSDILQYTISYQSKYIHIDSEYGVDFLDVFTEESENKYEQCLVKLFETEKDLIEGEISKKIMSQRLLDYIKIENTFPYLFNNITCLNVNSGQIETIRLSPYYDIITPDRLANYDGLIYRKESHALIYSEKKGACLAESLNQHGYGSVCTLSKTMIEEILPTGQKTTWIPLPAIEEITNVSLNKMLVLKDAENADSADVYLYLSTKGLFYKGEIVVTPMSIKKDAIVYDGVDKSFAITTLETGELAVLCLSGETKIAKKYNVKSVINPGDINNIASLQPFADLLTALSDTEICDGTKFESFGKNDSSSEFDFSAIVEIVREHWKVIAIIIVLIFIFF
ncbi:MAG: hypothetical protein J6U73_07430 [Alistipes sp.]|nr:hypothetical protein [Alistipes sp.]